VPYAQTIPYMEKSPILQEWRRLNDEGKLTGAQKLWFDRPKPAEELYDTQADPYEVNNLAGNPQYAERLKQMRAALEQWMKDVHDQGGVPEDELIQRFWPGHQQPVTASPVLHRDNEGTVTIACATPGASIGYRLGNDRQWRIYTGPFKTSETIHARAIRLGYKASREIQEKNR
jgi:N-sulfoglucosamine sulfohydrolase